MPAKPSKPSLTSADLKELDAQVTRVVAAVLANAVAVNLGDGEGV
jgi:hypothetical protein